jgi:hypothetical protein
MAVGNRPDVDPFGSQRRQTVAPGCQRTPDHLRRAARIFAPQLRQVRIIRRCITLIGRDQHQARQVAGLIQNVTQRLADDRQTQARRICLPRCQNASGRARAHSAG